MNLEHNVEGFQLIAELSLQDSFDSNKCRIIHDPLPIEIVIIQYVLTQFCGVLTVEEQLSCTTQLSGMLVSCHTHALRSCC